MLGAVSRDNPLGVDQAQPAPLLLPALPSPIRINVRYFPPVDGVCVVEPRAGPSQPNLAS